MIGYALRRIAGAIPVLIVVALFMFSLLFIAPGDPATVIAGDQASPLEVAQIRTSLGLDQPFLVRFGQWSWQVVHGDLGVSIFTSQPVSLMIQQRLGPTFSLLVLTIVLAVSVAVPLGVIAAWKKGKAIDRLVMAIAISGFSVPVFVIGYLFAFVFASRLGWLPVQGYVPMSEGFGSFLSRLILPAATLSVSYIGLIARMTRAAVLEVLSQDYIRTAKAKGLLPAPVLFKHALKNAANPIVTVVGLGVASLIGGTVVTESVFAIPGLGRLTVDAIAHRDYPIIQGVGLLFSVGLVVVNLVTDLSYKFFDPRIRY